MAARARIYRTMVKAHLEMNQEPHPLTPSPKSGNRSRRVLFPFNHLKWLAAGVLLTIPALACNVTLTDPNAPPPTVTTVSASSTPNTNTTVTADVTTVISPSPAPTVQSNAPTSVLKATPSYIPATPTTPPPTVSPVPTVSLNAKVCSTCVALRVREKPDTTSKILTELPSGTDLKVIGRSSDGGWFLIVTADGTTGWGYGPFITVTGDMNTVSIINIQGGVVGTSSGAGDNAVVPASGAPLDGNIVTGVTSTSRQIFLLGQQRGNLPAVFTRVGDSLTAAQEFLRPFSSGKPNLGAYSALQITLGYFSSLNGRGANPFISDSIAERNNWTTADVLNPANAFPDICQPGETPLACEYRVVRPSVALILIGTNDAAREVTPGQFQTNLQRIVQISKDMGVIPVLSTLPPKHLDDWNNARVDQFNGIILGVARAHDIPLWNFWLALQNLPNNGILPDGVHLNAPPDKQSVTFDESHLRYGYPMRNLTALQVLDVLRRQVLYGGTVTVETPGSNTSSSGLSAGSGGPTTAPIAGSCNSAPLPRLVVGRKGRVTPGVPNKLRAGPHKDDTVIGYMNGGSTFDVIGGPVCGDGLRWWQVTYNGLNAWTADGQGTDYWLEPAG
jgi:uncharacterized protein YgiM (DUF1202 family)